MTIRSATPLFAALAAALSCTPSSAPAPLDARCRVEVVNEGPGPMTVTAFGRGKLELGRVEEGGRAAFDELCIVDRVSVRGTPASGSGDDDPVWAVAVLKRGSVVRVRLSR